MFTVEQFFEVLLTTGEPTAEGLRLPTERDLAERTGLSRASVREHLSALRVMGLLTKTQGSANVLHVPSEESSAAIYRVLLQMRHATLADVAEAREMFEIGMIPFVCRRIEDVDLDRLSTQVTLMAAASRAGDLDAAIDADLAFHRLLFESLHNPIVDFAFGGMRVSLRDVLAVRRAEALAAEMALNNGQAPTCYVTDSVHDHIVDALRARDPRAATAAMTLHYDQFRDLVARGEDLGLAAITPTPRRNS